jgi:hypothetical protein
MIYIASVHQSTVCNQKEIISRFIDAIIYETHFVHQRKNDLLIYRLLKLDI